ncbi:MAG: hypothetical protein HFG51_14890 [Lachnospiraceae bacterium]|nr:hypothetical protein [Lachnospiraceae bacterium]
MFYAIRIIDKLQQHRDTCYYMKSHGYTLIKPTAPNGYQANTGSIWIQ